MTMTTTIDATCCQKNIAKEFIGGYYLLAVKGNQEASLRIIQDTLAEHFESNARALRGSRHESHEVKHDRNENREYVSRPASASLKNSARAPSA